jgi:hypothetical protein
MRNAQRAPGAPEVEAMILRQLKSCPSRWIGKQPGQLPIKSQVVGSANARADQRVLNASRPCGSAKFGLGPTGTIPVGLMVRWLS